MPKYIVGVYGGERANKTFLRLVDEVEQIAIHGLTRDVGTKVFNYHTHEGERVRFFELAVVGSELDPQKITEIKDSAIAKGFVANVYREVQ